MLIESKVLSELQRGSFEDKLMTVSKAVRQGNVFGEEVVLFATYDDKVIVANDKGEFLESEYSIKEGIVSFRRVKPVLVESVSTDRVVSGGVDGFYSGGGLTESMRSLVALSGDEQSSLLEDVSVELKKVFSGGGVWKRYLNENRGMINKYVWDVSYAMDKYSKGKMFFDALSSLEEDKDYLRDELSRMLEKESKALRARLNKMLSFAEASYERFRSGSVNIEEDFRAGFESFASDYVQYLKSVVRVISESIIEHDEECLCMAKVHDEVSSRLFDMALAGRFVQKISLEGV